MNNINFGKSFSSSTAAAAAIFDCVVLTSLFIEVSILPATLSVVGAAGAGAEAAGVGAGVDEGAGMDVSTSAASVAGLESAPSSHEGVSPSTIFYLFVWYCIIETFNCCGIDIDRWTVKQNKTVLDNMMHRINNTYM